MGSSLDIWHEEVGLRELTDMLLTGSGMALIVYQVINDI